MINRKKLLILLLVLIGISSLFIFCNRINNKNQPPSPVVTQEQTTALTLNIDGKTESFDISSFVGKSALEATNSFAKVVESGAGENAFVTEINGRAADSKKREFWELVINGQSAQVGAGSYTIQKGDSILWKITTY
ncbi:MAG: DUF4430 domain-containing protein [Candidatus Woesebacteria bacterium]|nr:MAG: DUF4430 domain-containing protein [Candidatus Woesebacteria bacterium]